MNPKIIAERDNSLILFEAGKVKTVPNTIYNQVKYRHYKGDRIFYKFDDDSYVQETFDDGIFNSFMSGETIQIRDSVQICESIQAHKLNHQDTQYNKLFKKLYFVEKKSELMKEMIDVFGDRVRTKTNKDNTTLYVVDERFMVNDSGVSHYKDDSGHYKFLCTVAQGNLSKMTIQTKIGEIELGATELTIMGKIGFLLAPDINDGVFFNQLTDKMQDVLRDEVLFDSENKTALGI
jgi:hypothetical protein|tara:strand:- start:11310 stop:12014 length:705 start_codon:yes stop_codon:yes gene_type:complete